MLWYALTSRVASVDLDECISRLYKKELLADSVIEAICAKAKELLMKESNVVHVQSPVTVVGDIHGQFFDMIEIFRIGGYCPDTNYLFLGTSRRPVAPAVQSPPPDSSMSMSVAWRGIAWQCVERQEQEHQQEPSLTTSNHRRLCRSRAVQHRNHLTAGLPQATLPRARPSNPWEPRK